MGNKKYLLTLLTFNYNFMRIHILTVVVLCLMSTALSAQTKRLAFLSQGGDPAEFERLINTDYFNSEKSDFGLPVPKEVKTYKLDSVIYVSDNSTILVTKEYQRLFTDPKDSAKFVRVSKDTVFNNELFAHRHSLDSIRAELKKQGYYINSKKINKVVFIGFDNTKPPVNTGALVTPKQNIVPLIVSYDKPGNNSPFDGELALMLGTIFLVSLLGGWLSWKFYQPRLQ